MRFPLVLIVPLLMLSAVAALPLSFMDEVSVEDPSGDASMGGVPADFLDITTVRAFSNTTHLSVEMDIVDAEAALRLAQAGRQASNAGQPWYWIVLEYQEEQFDIVWDLRATPEPDGSLTDRSRLDIYRIIGEDITLIHEQGAEVLVDDSRLTADVPLSKLVTTQRFSPGPGERIHVLSASTYMDPGQESHGDGSFGIIFDHTQGAVEGNDDVAFPSGSTLELEGLSTTELGLSTSEPIRFSNGEATTYHWPVAIQNNGEKDQALVISLDASGDLQTHAPQALHVPVGERVVADVFATAPFAHQHGGQRSLTVNIDGDGVHASLDLEIRYLEVPQPSGHHDTVYLHTSTGDRYWMDTLSEPDNVLPTSPLNAGQCKAGADQEDGRIAVFRLDPALVVGVDARMDEVVRVTGEFQSQNPRPEGALVAEFAAYSIAQGLAPTLLSGQWESARKEMPASTGSETVAFDLDLGVPKSLDFLEPGAGLNLAILIGFCAGMPVGSDFAPQVIDHQTGRQMSIRDASVELPFNDYHDYIEVDLGRGLAISAEDPIRRAAPGSTMLWQLATQGQDHARLDVNVLGVHADLLETHGSGFTVGDTIAVSTMVPNDVGERMEFIVEVVNQDDPTQTAAIRLVVEVDATATRDDAEAVALLREPDRNAPGFALPLLLAALFVLGKRRRS